MITRCRTFKLYREIPIKNIRYQTIPLDANWAFCLQTFWLIWHKSMFLYSVNIIKEIIPITYFFENHLYKNKIYDLRVLQMYKVWSLKHHLKHFSSSCALRDLDTIWDQNFIILYFSSPVPKAQVSFSDHDLSAVCCRCHWRRCRCRKLFTFSSSFIEPLGRFQQTWHKASPTGWRGFMLVQMKGHTLSKWEII